MDLEVKLFGIIRKMLDGMLADVDESALFELPSGGGNSPAWLLGHLTIANQLGCFLLGGEPPNDKLLALFGPGSTPDFDPADAPSVSDLRVAFGKSADAMCEAATKASEEQLAASRDGQLLAEAFPTVRDMLGHLLTTHFSLHVGQLSAWRRSRGLPSILQV